jgi:hypothetical protein
MNCKYLHVKWNKKIEQLYYLGCLQTVGISGYSCDLTADEPESGVLLKGVCMCILVSVMVAHYVVHDLSPAHVDVVAGLGDSITVSHMLCGVHVALSSTRGPGA